MTIRIKRQYRQEWRAGQENEYYAQMCAPVPGEWSLDAWWWLHHRWPRRDEFLPLKVAALVMALIVLALLVVLFIENVGALRYWLRSAWGWL